MAPDDRWPGVTGFQPEPGDDTTLRMPEVHCPACGYAQDAVSRPLGQKMGTPPKDGDFSVCFQCGEVNVFSVSVFGVNMRTATLEELQEFAANPRYAAYVRALHAFHAQRRGEA